MWNKHFVVFTSSYCQNGNAVSSSWVIFIKWLCVWVCGLLTIWMILSLAPFRCHLIVVSKYVHACCGQRCPSFQPVLTAAGNFQSWSCKHCRETFFISNQINNHLMRRSHGPNPVIGEPNLKWNTGRKSSTKSKLVQQWGLVPFNFWLGVLFQIVALIW